ncbi:MAG: tetratricopeptide repeat protein [Chloroflexota bacterium]|nr:tetratricopeptide repeat protein [Chloroflexota bacterium]
MSDDIQSRLNTAYEHVEAGRLDDALAVLQPILDTDPTNVDAWWIYTHAVSDPQDARRALQNVLQTAPDYPGAQEMMTLLDTEYPAPAPQIDEMRPKIRSLTPPPPPMSVPEPEPASGALETSVGRTASLDRPLRADMETPFGEPVRSSAPMDNSDSPRPAEGQRSSWLTIAVFAIVVAVIVVALLLFNNPGTTPESGSGTPTSIAAAGAETFTRVPTIALTELPVVTELTATVDAMSETLSATEEIATPLVIIDETATVEPTLIAEVTVEATIEAPETGGIVIPETLSGFTLAEAAITQETLSIGEAAVAHICLEPGRAARTLLPQAMEAFAQAAEALPTAIEALAVRLVNCDDGSALQTLAVTRVTAEQFAQGAIDAREFASGWTPIR